MLAKIFLKPYSALLFINNPYAGAILLLATFLNPSVAISGLISVVATIAFAEFISLREEYLNKGFYLYNSLLVGMGIGYIFSPTLISIFLTIILSFFTFVFSFVLNRLFWTYRVPILSLPFSIITIISYLASISYRDFFTKSSHTLFDINLPLFLSSYLKALGTIFFIPSAVMGLIIVFIILYFSRIMFVLSIIGFYFGVFLHSFLIGSFIKALNDIYSFNYILVAIALGGIFLLPTIRNFLIALIGVSLSVVIEDAIHTLFSFYHIPVYTLPFNMVVIAFVFILYLIGYKEFNYYIKETPEKSLSSYLSHIFRFGNDLVKISSPFSGKWSVYQAFDDEWTHKGDYKYAYDFVITKDKKSYRGDGLELSDYYAFGESILSPVNGYVIDCRHDLKDNPIGVVDRVNNWGNYIIIKADQGFFVEISHLMQYSLNVKVGDYVYVNSILAKCGNSGYSPEPHIHIQVQYYGILGSFTKYFVFEKYYKENRLLFNSLPKKGEEIENVIADKSMISRFTFIIGDRFTYEIFRNSKKLENFTITVKMNDTGEFYFEDEDKNRLYFYTSNYLFYFYNYEGKRNSFLKWFFILAAKIPLVNKQDIKYQDYLPLYLLCGKIKQTFIEFLSSFSKNKYKYPVCYKFSYLKISSEKGEVALGAFNKGFVSLKFKDFLLKIKSEEN